MITAETLIEGIIIDAEQNIRLATIRVGGIRIYWRDVSLVALFAMMLQFGIRTQTLQRGRWEQLGLLVEPGAKGQRDSVYFSDGRPVLRHFPERNFVNFDGATYEAELKDVSEPEKRELIVCTDSRNLLV